MLKYELKKLIGNKFLCIIFAFLFLLNAFLSFYEARNTALNRDYFCPEDEWHSEIFSMYERYESDPDAFMKEYEAEREYRELADEMSDYYFNYARENGLLINGTFDLADYWDEYDGERLNREFFTYRRFGNTAARIEEYPEKMQAIFTQAERTRAEYLAQGMSENDYAYRFQSDIIDIYWANRYIPLENEYVRGWEPYFAYSHGGLCLILFLLVLVTGMILDEKKSGIFPLIHATRGGHSSLILTKFAALLTTVTVAVIAFSGTTLLLYGLRYHGFSSLGGYVQLMEDYLYCPQMLKVGELLVVSVLIKILAMTALGMLVLMLSALLRSHALTYMSGLVLVAVNFVLHLAEYLDPNNPLRLMNAFAVMDTDLLFGQYYAINFFGFAIPAIPFIIGALLTVTAVCGGVTTYLFNRADGKSTLRLPQRLTRLFCKKRFRLPTIPCLIRTRAGYECHKLLVAGKFILLILIVLLVKVEITDRTTMPNLDPSDARYRSYMTLLEGEATDEKLIYIQEERDIVDDIIYSEKSMQNKYFKAEISYEEFVEYQDALEDAKVRDKALLQVEARRDHILALRAKGQQAYFVYDTGWNHLLTLDFDYLLYAAILLMLAGIFASEYRTGMAPILRATKGGRGRTFAAKLALAVFLAFGLGIVFAVIDYNAVIPLYRFPASDAPAASLVLFGNLRGNITIEQLFWIYESLRTLGFIVLAVATVSLSALLEKTVSCMSTIAAVTLVPYALTAFGLDEAKYVDFTALLSGHAYINLLSVSPLYGILFTAAVLILTVGLFSLCYRKWVGSKA